MSSAKSLSDRYFISAVSVEMLNGYAGKALIVNLEEKRIRSLDLDSDYCRKFIGGYGFGAKYLLDNQPKGISPFDPRSIIGFTTGPLTGTPAVIGARYIVVCKSPLTNCWGDANSGGDFGPRLKFSGYDNIFISGASDEWLYLLIDNGKAEFRSAAHLAGLDTNETETILTEEHGKDLGIASIGPAGEKLSLLSCIINNSGRAAARSGVGAVLGSKRIKAIVAKGDFRFPIFDLERMQGLRKQVIKRFEGPNFYLLSTYGTCGYTESSIQSGDCPTRNWTGNGLVTFPTAKLLDGENVTKHRSRKYGCWRCPVACGGYMKSSPEDSAYEYGVTHKPEYETLAAFGAMCLNDNIHSIIKANDICNRYGMDTISTGCTIAFAIDCFENGIINEHDTDGLVLRWGNHRAIVELVEKMGKREGFGDVLADGVKLASDRIGRGAEKFAVHIQGQEVPMHDPKVVRGFAATYWLDPTPARHTQGHEDQMPSGFEVPRYDAKLWSGRGLIHKIGSNLVHIVNCAGLCLFTMDVSSINDMIGFLNAATGWDCSIEELGKTGERIANLRHIFNLREGQPPHMRQVPDIVRVNPYAKTGPLAGIQVDYKTAGYDWMKEMQWDLETGKPDRNRLRELGIEEYAV